MSGKIKKAKAPHERREKSAQDVLKIQRIAKKKKKRETNVAERRLVTRAPERAHVCVRTLVALNIRPPPLELKKKGNKLPRLHSLDLLKPRPEIVGQLLYGAHYVRH